MGTEEKKRNIKGYEGLYQISRNGVIRSLDKYLPMPNGGEKLVKEKILKPYKNREGYLRVALSKNGKVKHYLIHRLVAEAFIDNPNNLPHIDHINTDRTDNRVENLRWCTHKENMNNSITKTKISNFMIGKKGIKHPSSKIVLQLSKDGELIKKWDCIRDVYRHLNISVGHIAEVCRGKRKTAGGYIWRYVDKKMVS